MDAHLRVLRRDILNRVVHRVPRVFRDRSNPLEDLSEDDVYRRYRFRPETVMFMLTLLPGLTTTIRRNCAVPPLLQLLVTLRYLASGGMHMLLGDSVELSRSTVGRIVQKTTRLLCGLAGQFIIGPKATTVKNGFSNIAGFPSVLGCVDDTFIRIRRPIKNEADFVNRKGYQALNVQTLKANQPQGQRVKVVKSFRDRVAKAIYKSKGPYVCLRDLQKNLKESLSETQKGGLEFLSHEELEC